MILTLVPIPRPITAILRARGGLGHLPKRIFTDLEVYLRAIDPYWSVA
jgi:hypothetical protein